jgi:hypothetical protein
VPERGCWELGWMFTLLFMRLKHGLTNYIDSKAKCRHLEKITCKRTMRQGFSRVYRLDSGYTFNHVGIFDPAL